MKQKSHTKYICVLYVYIDKQHRHYFLLIATFIMEPLVTMEDKGV